jgi:hypothetical protein
MNWLCWRIADGLMPIDGKLASDEFASDLVAYRTNPLPVLYRKW